MSTTAIASTVIAVVTTISAISIEDFQADALALLIVGFVIAFILAFAVGANDVANSFGTTVGAKTLTLRQACILASIFEALGAILLGAKVGETIRKGIIDPTIYEGNEKLLMVGEVSAMMGSGLWQLIATFLKLPVSGTHSIVGATVGFSLVAMGAVGVNWGKIGHIVASWFISPLLAGGMAAVFYWALRKLIFNKPNPVPSGLVAMPILYSFTLAINFFSIFFSGAPLLGFDKIPLWGDFVIAFVVAIITYIVVSVFVVKLVKKSIEVEREKHMADVLLKPSPETANNIGLKKTMLPPTLETISEKEPLMEEEDAFNDGKPNGTNPQNGAGDAPVKAIKEIDSKQLSGSPRKISGSKNSTSSAGDVKTHKWQFSHRPSTEEPNAPRQRARKPRSHSTGDHHVRIPPLLQLEKNVLKARTPEPTVTELKTAIRKNFSEPSMVTLAEKLGGEFFEVHIDRQKRAVTIQRKKRTKSSADAISELSFSQSHGNLADSGRDPDGLLDGVPHTQIEQLEEPFEDSEDEGNGLIMKSSKSEEVLVIASDQKSYTGAIEEGFRKLSAAPCTDVIEVKVAGGKDDDSETGEVKSGAAEEEDREERMEVRKIFSFLQVLTACFGSFAHGGNDVSNAIGPLIALYIIYSEAAVHQIAHTPIWILFYGGVGICAGMWVWGRRVIKTMGEDLTSLTPSRGFTIELTSAVTVLAASNVGIPVSTTHCKVGAIVCVGWVRSRKAVDWKIFRNIVLAWFVTVPVSAGLSALVFLIMKTIMGL